MQTDFIETAFDAGNYAGVALEGRRDDWRTWAALGLVGRTQAALDGLKEFTGPEAKFYGAVANWIDGDDARALSGLKDLTSAQAQRLRELIRKPKIQVLTQLDRGSQWDFITALERDPKFAVRNVGFRSGDVPNQPDADVKQFVDPRQPPDFYVAKLVEWHVLPRNLPELPCPVFGHTADYDIHIQTVHPWLQLFDELVVTDPTEWNDVTRLASCPVSAFPKAFALGGRLPEVPAQARPTDVFVSGTALHPYHPDKARLLHQILEMPELAVKFVNGFLSPKDYHDLLGQTKVGFTYVRHPGAMPTRGLESLAMGAAIAVQEGSVLQLFAGENEGVITYDLEKGNLPGAVRRILGEWPEFEKRARRGAEIVRREFDLARVASQYFRFLTFLAAKPRGARRPIAQAPLEQKRSILLKGWVQSPRVNRRLRQAGFARWTERIGPHEPGSAGILPAGTSLRTRRQDAGAPSAAALSLCAVIDMARDLILEYTTAAYPPVARDYGNNFQIKLAADRSLLTQALALSRAGVASFPDSLVLRFNWIRAALHFGEPHEVTEAIGLAEETLRRPVAEWQVDVMDDVFPWDYFSQFFNYRAYFDACTAQLQAAGAPAGAEPLARLLLASICYYLSFHTKAEPVAQAQRAVELDPEFPFYKLQCARLLAADNSAVSRAAAVPLLVELVERSMLFLPAFEQLEMLRREHGCTHPSFGILAAKVRMARSRLWTASYGVEDWDAIPLRNSEFGIRNSEFGDHRSEFALRTPHSALRILFLPLEIAEWKQARYLAYPVQLGLEEGFAAQGAQVVTIPRVRGLSLEAQAMWLREVQAQCEAGGFDQVWAEVVHSEWDTEALGWLETVAPKRVGLLMESLGYDPAAFAVAPQLRERRALVERRLRHFTHVVAVDEQDAAELSQQGTVAAAWWPQAVPRRFISALPEAPPDLRALFFGQLYGERQAWLEHPAVQPLLWRPDVSPEDTAGLPPLFDGITRALGTALDRGTRLGPEDWRAFTEAWRAVRRTGFGVWLRGLQQGAAVVNLPSLFRGYAGRVVEAMAAGRPVVSWDVADRPRTRSLFKDGSEILLFNKDDPAALAAHLRRLRHEPAWARQLAENARRKILRGHTVEIRMRQLLAWIETGVAPDYAAVSDAAEEASFTPIPLEPALAPRLAEEPTGLAQKAEGASGSREGARELHQTTGIVQWHLGDLERAARDRRTAATNLLDDAAQVQEAEVTARLGHWPEALEALQRALERVPDHPAAWKLIGDWSLAQGDGAMAAEAYGLLVARDRCDLGAYVDLALARLKTAQAGSNGANVGTTSHELERRSPTRRVPRFGERAGPEAGAPGFVAASQEMRQLATQFLPRARANVERISRSITRGELPPVARIGHLGEARRLLERADLPAAWASAVQAIEARPFHPEGFLLLAEIAQAAGDGERARAGAERASKLAPKWKPARNFLKALPAARSAAPRVQLPDLPARLTSRTPRLTVCLIVRNEERFLGQCLESIRNVADQIVVVDTGSTDWTKDIAVRFGAEVYSYSWHEDFSAARNVALEHATGDWVLVLDADEEVRAADLPLLRQEMRQASVMALRLPIVDVGREDDGQSYVPRLFRNAPGLFFVGRVHEQVFSSIEVRRAEWGLENRLGRTTLRHHGYVAAVHRERRKNARNLALLERALDELPDEPNLVLNYGLELMRAGRPAEALERYAEAFLLLSAQPRELVVAELRESLLTQYATHLLSAGRFEAVIDVLESPLAQAAGLTASMHFLFGMAQIELQEWARAIPQFRACLAKRNQPALSPLHLEVRRGAPHHCLAVCQMRLRRFTDAGQSFAAALAGQPEARPIRFDYAMFLAESGRPVEGLKVLHEMVTEIADEPAPWLLGARIALSRPEFAEFANDWTSEALRYHGYATAFQALRAEALLLSQDVGQAHSHWLRAQHPPNPRHAAALMLCGLLRGEDLPVPSLPEPLVSGELLNWYRRLIEWRAVPLVEGINAKLEKLRRVLPSACGVLDQALHEAGREAV